LQEKIIETPKIEETFRFDKPTSRKKEETEEKRRNTRKMEETSRKQ
jgi:hypothetical protein